MRKAEEILISKINEYNRLSTTNAMSQFALSKGEIAVFVKAMEEFAIEILDGASNFNSKERGQIELIAGNYYLDADKEGDNPLDGKQVYELYKTTLK